MLVCSPAICSLLITSCPFALVHGAQGISTDGTTEPPLTSMMSAHPGDRTGRERRGMIRRDGGEPAPQNPHGLSTEVTDALGIGSSIAPLCAPVSLPCVPCDAFLCCPSAPLLTAAPPLRSGPTSDSGRRTLSSASGTTRSSILPTRWSMSPSTQRPVSRQESQPSPNAAPPLVGRAD